LEQQRPKEQSEKRRNMEQRRPKSKRREKPWSSVGLIEQRREKNWSSGGPKQREREAWRSRDEKKKGRRKLSLRKEKAIGVATRFNSEWVFGSTQETSVQLIPWWYYSKAN